MDPDGATTEFPTVECQVVLERPGPTGRVTRGRCCRIARLRDEQDLVLRQHAAERIVRGVPTTVVRVPLVHREAVDPDVGEDVGVCQAEPLTELDTQTAQDVGRDVVRVCDDQDEVAFAGPGALHDRALRLVGQELRDRALDLAARFQRQIGEALGAEATRALRQFIDLPPGDGGHAGCDDRLHPVARREGRIEDAEARPRRTVWPDERWGEIDELHPEPDVRLVGAVALQRFLERQQRERRLLDRPVRDRLA